MIYNAEGRANRVGQEALHSNLVCQHRVYRWKKRYFDWGLSDDRSYLSKTRQVDNEKIYSLNIIVFYISLLRLYDNV